MIANYPGIVDPASGSTVTIMGTSTSGGWWNDWGKCAFGTAGGAILGGLTGAAAGSSVPALGTGAGAIIGAIGGGLAGAAASC